MRTKTMKCGRGLLIGVAVCLVGCAPARVSSATYSRSSAYPPTNPIAVQLLREFPSEGTYIKLGEVSADMPLTFAETDETFEAKLKAEAARIGADAVVVRQDEPHKLNRSETTWSEHTYKDKKGRTHTYGSESSGQDEYGRKFFGIAIKFTT